MTFFRHRYFRRVLYLCCAAFACEIAFAQNGINSTQQVGSSHLFTVRDSIEMTTFSDPFQRSTSAKSKCSPDGKLFFVITTKGILKENELLSTIWLYDARRVTAFLHDATTSAPQPHLLWRIRATPKVQQFDSYGSLITRAQWSSDSTSILFLAETGDGIRHLYRVSAKGGEKQLLSPPLLDVEDFTESSGTIAYVSKSGSGRTEQIHHTLPGGTLSATVTGMTLLNILDPVAFPVPGSFYTPSDLWVRRNGRRIRVNADQGTHTWHYPIAAGSFFRLTLSPSGNALIAAKPVLQIPPSWQNYLSVVPDFEFGDLPKTRANEGEDWNWPWQYIYVDLNNNRAEPMVDAPSAWLAGYGDPPQASWSPDGTRVIVTNTFLPMAGNLDQEKKVVPCAAAVFAVLNKGIQCVVYARYPKLNMHIQSASFGQSSREVSLEWMTASGPISETYQQEANSWILKSSTASPTPRRVSIVLSVHQALNEPPVLWATDPRTGKNKELWNPNPQLSTMLLGQAAIFRWKDASGYEWTAGLVRPYGYKPGNHYPLVIQTHGFDQQEFLVDGAYTTGFAAQPLAAAGIMVLQMSSRSDRHFQPVSEEASSFADGCAAAIHKLTEDGSINPLNVGIIGFSRTSWYVETTLEKYPQLFKAATIIDGVDQGYVSYMLFCPKIASCKADHEAANGGPPFGKGLYRWLSTAPGFNLDRMRTPLRIEAIGWPSLLAEWELYSSLFQQGKPVKLIYIPEGQHILQEPQERFASQQGNVDWFRSQLQNKGSTVVKEPGKSSHCCKSEDVTSANQISQQ